MPSLEEERKTLKSRIRGLEDEKATVDTQLARFPPMPHDNPTNEEAVLFNRHNDLSHEIAMLTESYENLMLESTEAILQGLAEDSRAVKRLTVWLLILTFVLSLGTILDVLTRLGILR